MTAQRAVDRVPPLHPVVRAAGEEATFPPWTRCVPERREHCRRVQGLMGEWAETLALADQDRQRWRAAGLLHDALRDADANDLRQWTDLPWPPKLLHGPACAARLRAEGVTDQELLDAISYHTVGHAGLAAIGRFLYMADFLDPHRGFMQAKRAELRAGLPGRAHQVLPAIVRLRLGQRLEQSDPLLPESVEFWNQLVGE